MSNVDKFNYLNSLLEGTAASAIAGLSLTEENYDSAVELLNNRFGKCQVIISSHMDSMLNLESVVNAADIKGIRQLYDEMEIHIRSLQSLGVSSESYGTLLVPVILNKIPEELRLLISRKFDKDKWEVSEILMAFKEELEARERCVLMKASSSSSPQRNGMQSRGKAPFTASALNAGKNNSTSPSCTFCSQHHASSKCSIVTNVAARRAILRKKGKCFLCLTSGHLARNCSSHLKCFKCGNHHHTALCEKDSHRFESGAQQSQRVSQFPPRSGGGTSTMCVNSNTSVLLETARAAVGSPNDPPRKVNARIIFDSCSQRTYVSHRLQDTLKLPQVGADELLVKAFGDETPKSRYCELVQLSITSVDGMELYVNA